MTSYAELIHILSVICSIGFLAFFFSKKGHLCSLKNIFIFLWSYYVFCVPLDKALGIKMLTSSSLAFLDLNLPESLQTINYVTLLYVILLVGFLVGYSTVNVKCDERRSPFCKLLPSYITVLVINLLVFGLNFYVFGGETRTGKALLIRNDFLYKLIFAPTILVGALNAVYIYLSNNKKGVFWVFIAACIGIFLSGGRTVIVYYTLRSRKSEANSPSGISTRIVAERVPSG